MIRVLIVDDHKIVRIGLTSLLEAEGDIKIVGAASNGQEAVKLAAELHPDVIIMDIMMPKLDGVEATRMILEGKRKSEKGKSTEGDIAVQFEDQKLPKVLLLTSYGTSDTSRKQQS